ncbi:MAG: TPR end-of-group domain-containing protein [Thermoanaerobaculia bacterium]
MRRLWIVLLFAMSVSAQERGKLIEHVAAKSDPTQTYTLYLPSHYDASKQYPVLLILDPRGRSVVAAEIFRDAADEYQWILISSNDTRSDVVENNPNPRALNAIVPDAFDRYASDDRRIYMTGFSGTAMLSWSYSIWSKRIAGVIGVCGRYVKEIPPSMFSFAHYGFAGDSDFNNREMREVEAILDKDAQQPHRFEMFEGDHRWITPELARDALGWFEIIAMKQGRRTRDDALIDKLFAADVAKAGSGFEGLRRYRAIARTYEGLHAIDDVNAQITALENDRAVQREQRDQAQWDEFERMYLRDVHSRATLFVTEDNVEAAFRLAELKKRAKKDGLEGRTARRLLEADFAQLAHYLPTQLFEAKRYDDAVRALKGAIAIHDDRWPIWYNLGAAHSRRRDRRHALDALEKAVERGFNNGKMLADDDDYAFVRNDPRYVAIVTHLANSSQ